MATLLSSAFASGWDPAVWVTQSDTATFAGSGTGTVTSTNAANFQGYAYTKNTSVADMGVLFRMNQPGTAAGHHVRLVLRAPAATLTGGHAENVNGLVLEWNDATTSLGFYVQNASFTGFDTGITSLTTTSQIGSWFWHRIELQGSTFRYRYWADGNSEPSTWAVNQAVTNLTNAPSTGRFGIGTGNYPPATGGVLSVDDFSMYDFSANVISGAATLSAASSMTSAAVVSKLGAQTMSAASALSATAFVTMTGTPNALSAASSLTVDGSLLIDAGSLAWTGLSRLVVDGAVVAPIDAGIVALDGTGDLLATGGVEYFVEVALDGRLSPDLWVSAEVYPLRWRLITPSRRVHHLGLGRFSAHLQGLSLVKDHGFWKTVEGETDLLAYEQAFLGGYTHWITRAVYDELVAAGYGAYVSVVLPQPPITPVKSGFGSGEFGSGEFGSGSAGSPAYSAGVYSQNSFQEDA